MFLWLLNAVVNGDLLLHLVYYAANNLSREVRLDCLLDAVVKGKPLLQLVFCAPNHLTCELRFECLLDVVAEGKPLLHHVSHDFGGPFFDKEFLFECQRLFYFL